MKTNKLEQDITIEIKSRYVDSNTEIRITKLTLEDKVFTIQTIAKPEYIDVAGIGFTLCLFFFSETEVIKRYGKLLSNYKPNIESIIGLIACSNVVINEAKFPDALDEIEKLYKEHKLNKLFEFVEAVGVVD